MNFGSTHAISRRRALASIGAGAVATSLPSLAKADRQFHEVELVAREISQPLLAPDISTPILSYGRSYPPEPVRLRMGQTLRATLRNELTTHTSIHWHGVRLQNEMDGVPFLTQAPVPPGESFTYEFMPPDAGSFFFHPHCNAVEALGRGLAGILIVEGDTQRDFDAEMLCIVKDWYVNLDGSMGRLYSDKGAAKAGTFGNVRTVNGTRKAQGYAPAGGDVRLRLYNIDNSRIFEVGIEGAEAYIIATDGNPIDPLPLKSRRIGPAQRMDLAWRMPPEPGASVKIMNYFAAEPIELMRVDATTAIAKSHAFDPHFLRRNAIPEPDLARAEILPLALSANPSGVADTTGLPPDLVLPNGDVIRYADALCLTQRTFWSMNGIAWPEMSEGKLPPPLATLRKGRSYVMEITNHTPHMHPIHLHGHTFKVLEMSRQKLPPFFADTVLVEPKERVRIGFVADNPGDWMLHCHIVEHQDTGMMGYVRVA